MIAGSNAPFVGSLLADLTAAGHSVSSVATSEDALAAIATSHAVAALVDAWAHAMSVPEPERHRWLRAVWLHDALRDGPDE